MHLSMSETNKKIDKYMKKQLFKKIAFCIFITLSLSLFFLIAYMPPMGKQSENYGCSNYYDGYST